MLHRNAVLGFCLLPAVFLASCSWGQKSESQPPAGQQPAKQSQAAAPAVPQGTPPEQPVPVQKAEPAVKSEAAPVRAEARPAAPPVSAAKTPSAAAPRKETPAAAAPAEPVARVAAPENPPRPAEVPVPAPPKPQPVRIPSGTRFEVRIIEPIDSSRNKSGDTFRATLDQDLQVDGKVVVSRGTVVTGTLSDVKQPGRVEGRAALSMILTKITIGGDSYPIQTNTLSFEAEKTLKQDATKVGIGAGVGAIIGAIAGGGKGAAIGAAVGGGAGTATVLATKGKDVKFGAEERFSFVLRSDLEIAK
jgi:hypothetical protein